MILQEESHTIGLQSIQIDNYETDGELKLVKHAAQKFLLFYFENNLFVQNAFHSFIHLIRKLDDCVINMSPYLDGCYLAIIKNV